MGGSGALGAPRSLASARGPGAARIAIIEDEALARAAMTDALSALAPVAAFATLAEARAGWHGGIEVCVLDRHLPDGSGLALIELLEGGGANVRWIVVTGDPSFDHAVQALRLGLADYLTKPLDVGVLMASVQRALSLTDDCGLVEPGAPPLGLDATEARLAWRAAKSELPVLLTGETGTGKTWMAHWLHAQGPRSGGPFVSINCAALPANLVEFELFGAEKGAFTGAAQTTPGLFETAAGGTMFLDEIGEMPLALQAKLLDVVESGFVRRLGGRQPRRVDVRIISATLADPLAEGGALRQDLYYRLGVIELHLPALRERPESLFAWVERLLADLGDRPGGLRLAEEEWPRLLAYGWPGNLRELRNALQRSALLDAPEPLRPTAHLRRRPTAAPAALGPITATPAPVPSGISFGGLAPEETEALPTLAALESAHIDRVLRSVGGRKEEAARVLGIAPSTLRRRLQSGGDEG